MEFQIRYSVKERKGGIFGKKSIEELRRKTVLSLGSMKDSDLHDSGLRLVNTKVGVQLNRKGSVSGNVKCHIFILSVTQFIVANRELKSVT